MFESFFPAEPHFGNDAHLDLTERLKRRAWKVENLILHSDLPWIDIELEISAMRQMVEDEQPERLPLFDMAYGARFDRLEMQWGRSRPAF